MNKEQSADDPSVDLIRENTFNSTISMSYPDVKFVPQNYVLKHSEQLRQRW